MHADPSSSPPLWDFAVAIYTQDGITSLCLRLQDEHELDVAIVLSCLWLAYCGHSIDPARLEVMLDAAEPRHARVERIRAVRREVGAARADEPGWQAAYGHLQTAELAGERVEFRAIERAMNDMPAQHEPRDHSDARQRALDGLRHYARHAGVSSCDALLDELAGQALDPAPAGG